MIANGAPPAGSEATIDTRSCIKGELGSIAIVPGEAGRDATGRIRAVALLGGISGSKITEAKQCLDKPGAPECIARRGA
ncbi:hypothetical protein BH09MYX1_BH09MYX1_05850 [soil metagenome]